MQLPYEGKKKTKNTSTFDHYCQLIRKTEQLFWEIKLGRRLSLSWGEPRPPARRDKPCWPAAGRARGPEGLRLRGLPPASPLVGRTLRGTTWSSDITSFPSASGSLTQSGRPCRPPAPVRGGLRRCGASPELNQGFPLSAPLAPQRRGRSVPARRPRLPPGAVPA